MAMQVPHSARPAPVELIGFRPLSNKEQADRGSSISSKLSSVTNGSGRSASSPRPGLLTKLANRLFYGSESKRTTFEPGIRKQHDALVANGLAKKVCLEGSGGRLEGYFHHALSSESSKVVLFLHDAHGRAENQSLPIVEGFRQKGMDVLAVNLRGFGGSAGVPSEAGHHDDAIAMFNYLVDDLRVDPRDISVYGLGLGSPVGAKLAQQAGLNGEAVEGLVLDRPLASRDAAKGLTGLPGSGKFDPLGLRKFVADRVGRYSLEDNLAGLSANTRVGVLGPTRELRNLGPLFERCTNLYHAPDTHAFKQRHGQSYADAMQRFTRVAADHIHGSCDSRSSAGSIASDASRAERTWFTGTMRQTTAAQVASVPDTFEDRAARLDRSTTFPPRNAPSLIQTASSRETSAPYVPRRPAKPPMSTPRPEVTMPRPAVRVRMETEV